jgi:hypothetical protein
LHLHNWLAAQILWGAARRAPAPGPQGASSAPASRFAPPEQAAQEASSWRRRWTPRRLFLSAYCTDTNDKVGQQLIEPRQSPAHVTARDPHHLPNELATIGVRKHQPSEHDVGWLVAVLVHRQRIQAVSPLADQAERVAVFGGSCDAVVVRPPASRMFLLDRPHAERPRSRHHCPSNSASHERLAQQRPRTAQDILQGRAGPVCRGAWFAAAGRPAAAERSFAGFLSRRHCVFAGGFFLPSRGGGG